MNTLSVTLPTTLSTLRMPYRALRTCTLLACAMAAAGASWAQGTVLMQGPHAQVTTADIQANLAVLPPERQNQILQSSDTLRAMVENMAPKLVPGQPLFSNQYLPMVISHAPQT